MATIFAMYARGFRRLYFDIIGTGFNILVLYLLFKYRKEYIFPSRLKFTSGGEAGTGCNIDSSYIWSRRHNAAGRRVQSTCTRCGYCHILHFYSAHNHGNREYFSCDKWIAIIHSIGGVLGIAIFLGAITTFLEYEGYIVFQEQDFCDEIIDVSKVLNDYMLKSKGVDSGISKKDVS